MTKQNKKEKNLNKEKLFKDSVPRSRVQLDIVKRVRKAVESMPQELPAKIISYQDVIREDGEYYLLYQGSKELKPLAEYLNKNSISSQKLLEEFKEILNLIKNFEQIEELFPAGINAFNFWIDEKEDIYLIPEEMLRIKRNYNNFELKLPTKDYFTPPEMIKGEEWELKSYLFNTAAVFYYFISGETIFRDQDNAKVLNKIKTEKILDLKALVPELSDELNTLFMELLAKDITKRPELDYAAEKLGQLANSNNFKLKAFLEREDLINKKIVKKKRRNENIKLFFRQSWKVILFFAIVGGGLLWGLTSGPPDTITADTSPKEVVNHFYKALATKNVGLAKEAAAFDLGEMNRMISETHVIEKMQEAYSGSDSKDVKKVYSLEKLELKEVSNTEDQHRFKASYEFNFRNKNGSFSHNIEDELLVEQVDGIWRITEIKGGFKDMTVGEYPWEEE